MNILSRGSSKGIGFGGMETDPATGNLRSAAFNSSGSARPTEAPTAADPTAAAPSVTSQTNTQAANPYGTAADYLSQVQVPQPPKANPLLTSVAQAGFGQAAKSLGNFAADKLKGSSDPKLANFDAGVAKVGSTGPDPSDLATGADTVKGLADPLSYETGGAGIPGELAPTPAAPSMQAPPGSLYDSEGGAVRARGPVDDGGGSGNLESDTGDFNPGVDEQVGGFSLDGAPDAGSIWDSESGGWIDGGGEAAADFAPGIGQALQLAQGNVKGAIGSTAGAAIGNAIFPGVGGAVGGWLGGQIGGGCFVTEAVMSAAGQGDGGMELETLRQFRDTSMMATPQGQALVQEYEAIAPMVVESVSQRPDAMQIFQSIKAQFIDPAVEAIQVGNTQLALQIYAKMMAYVTPLAVESASEGGYEQEGGAGVPGAEDMDDFGDLASGMAGSPDMLAMIGGDDVEGTDGMPSTDGGQMMNGGAAALSSVFPRVGV